MIRKQSIWVCVELPYKRLKYEPAVAVLIFIETYLVAKVDTNSIPLALLASQWKILLDIVDQNITFANKVYKPFHQDLHCLQLCSDINANPFKIMDLTN